MSDPIPAVIYAAKSTEDTRGSIPTQLADCRKMAEREGWQIVDEYQDEAASAWRATGYPASRPRWSMRRAPPLRCLWCSTPTGLPGATLAKRGTWSKSSLGESSRPGSRSAAFRTTCSPMSGWRC